MKKPSVKRVDVLEVNLPFKKPFKHALHERRVSNSIFVKVYLENGVTGFGEALPRKYVTNETAKSVSEELRQILPRTLIGTNFSDLKDIPGILAGLNGLAGAARCSVEMALLDALGAFFNEPISAIIGHPIRNTLFSTGVISAATAPSVIGRTLGIKLFGFKTVKVKVGVGDDLERLRIVRRILGNKIDIRVDANCAWGVLEAIERIDQMRRFGVTAVEQPVRSDDFGGLKKITDSVPEAIIADESLTTIEGAESLAMAKACNIFNIRLSKCGGILNALSMVDIARRYGMRYLLGCQVGESGLLSAAGRHFACGVGDMEYYEGSYGRLLLKEDVTKENMTVSLGGKARAVTGPGLGVTAREKILDKYTLRRIRIE